MKYIIDIPDDKEYAYVNEEKTFLRIPISLGENKSKSISAPTLLRITPYTETDRDAIENEVWSMVKDIALNMTPDDYRAYFGVNDAESIFKLCGCLETIDKYGAWKKQKDEIHVGDEVLPSDTNFDVVIVTRLWKDAYDSACVDTIGYDGRIYSFLENRVLKTGRHFPEVTELLNKLKEYDEEKPE